MIPHPSAICLIVPCYNEAQRLAADVFLQFLSANAGFSFCFVNDGSADATGQVLRDLAARSNGRAIAIDLPANAGKAEAVRAGINHVIALPSRPEWIGYWDADLAAPLDEALRFAALIERRPETVMAMGTRVRRMGARVERRPARHYLGRAFATIASLTLGLPVYDTQCGAKMIRADLAAKLFTEPFISRWIFDVEILARVLRHIDRRRALDIVVEIPLECWSEVGGSRVKPAHFLRAPLDLSRIREKYFS